MPVELHQHSSTDKAPVRIYEQILEKKKIKRESSAVPAVQQFMIKHMPLAS